MGMDRPIEFLKMEKIEEKEEGKTKKKKESKIYCCSSSQWVIFIFLSY